MQPIRTLTPYQMQLLSDIFRLVLKEIKTDEDKESLAPGEVGVSYNNGCFYVRNPYTGEIFSPNSLDHITQILSKYDEGTNILNADKVSGIKVYSSIAQIPQLPQNMSADTIIRQMEYPSILIAEIKQDTPDSFGFPGGYGVLTVTKMSPTIVTANFYDYRTYVNYEGRYNPFLMELEGWSHTGSMVNAEYTESVTSGNTVNISVLKPIDDLSVLVVKVLSDIPANSYVNVNEMGPLPLIDMSGEPIGYSITSNNIIMLIYDKARTSWILTEFTKSSLVSIMQIMNDRLTTMRSEFDTFKQQTATKFTELRDYVDTELKKPATIVPIQFVYHATNSTDNIPALENFVVGLDHLIINYHQTILHEGNDYSFDSDNSIRFNFTIPAGDDVHFVIIKQTMRT